MASSNSSYDLALASATLRANSSDVQALLSALVGGLSEALGDRVQTTMAGGRFRKAHDITAVVLSVGDEQFEAIVDGARLRCGVAHVSGGIRIRNEALDVDAWITRLVATLGAEAERSESARQALERLVIGGNQ